MGAVTVGQKNRNPNRFANNLQQFNQKTLNANTHWKTKGRRRMTDVERVAGGVEAVWHTGLHQITHSLGGLVPNAERSKANRTGLDQTRPIKTTSRLFLRPMSLPVSVSLCRLFIQAFEWRTIQRVSRRNSRWVRDADWGVWLRLRLWRWLLLIFPHFPLFIFLFFIPGKLWKLFQRGYTWFVQRYAQLQVDLAISVCLNALISAIMKASNIKFGMKTYV